MPGSDNTGYPDWRRRTGTCAHLSERLFPPRAEQPGGARERCAATLPFREESDRSGLRGGYGKHPHPCRVSIRPTRDKATYVRCCRSRNRQATEVRGHFPPGIRRQTVLH